MSGCKKVVLKGRGCGGQVVSVLPYNYDDPCSKLADVYCYYSEKMFEINEKEAEDGPFKKKLYQT